MMAHPSTTSVSASLLPGFEGAKKAIIQVQRTWCETALMIGISAETVGPDDAALEARIAELQRAIKMSARRRDM